MRAGAARDISILMALEGWGLDIVPPHQVLRPRVFQEKLKRCEGAWLDEGEKMLIRVANFPEEADEEDLESLFSTYGTVTGVKMFLNWRTGKWADYALVEMPNFHADRAIERLNGHVWRGRKLKVSERRPRRNDDDDD
jgi:RNA recognition motif-containing protein